MTIRIIIADDHPVVRSGIKNELAKDQDFTILQETMNTDDALALALEHTPDVLILDINMPGSIKAIDIVRKLKEAEHPTRILIITAYKEASIVIGAIQAGADGYLLKEEDIEQIPEAVHSVAQGNDWVSQSVTKVLTNQLKNNNKNSLVTKREIEVLQLVIEGLRNEEIANELGVSRRTVEFHISNIMKKLNLDNRGKIISWAEKNIEIVNSLNYV